MKKRTIKKVPYGETVRNRIARWDSMGQDAPAVSSRKATFLKYSAAFGAAAALATNAEAGIIHTVGPVSATTNPNLEVASNVSAQVSNGLAGLLFDMQVNRGVLTYSQYNNGQNGSAKLFGSNGGNLMFAFRPQYSHFLAVDFAAGQEIGAGANFRDNATVQTNHTGNNYGDFPHDGDTGFAGIRLNLNGNMYYGWVKLQLTVASNIQTPYGGLPGPTSTGLTAIDWAYNDVAGQSILAGDVGEGGGGGSETPEPATAGLAPILKKVFGAR